MGGGGETAKPVRPVFGGFWDRQNQALRAVHTGTADHFWAQFGTCSTTLLTTLA